MTLEKRLARATVRDQEPVRTGLSGTGGCGGLAGGVVGSWLSDEWMGGIVVINITLMAKNAQLSEFEAS